MSDSIVAERTRILAMTLAVLSLVATVVGLVYGRKLTPREISPYDSYGRGPLGTRVFVETLTRVGISIRREPDIDRILETRDPVIFLAPESSLLDVDGRIIRLDSVLAHRAERGARSVVVLPKWSLSSLGVARPFPEGELESILDATGLELTWTRTGRRTERPKRRPIVSEAIGALEVELPYPQTVLGDVATYATTDVGSLVVGDDAADVIVITDADLISNYAVTRADHAAIVVGMFRALGFNRVVVDETFHGRHRNKSLAEALGEWPGVLLLVQGAFVIAAVLLAGRRRFGRPKRVAEAYGRGPREAIAVAADVLTLGRSPLRLASRYVELMIRDVHRRLGMHEDGHTVDVGVAAEALDRFATQRRLPTGAVALLADARALVRDPIPAREALARAIATAGRAHALRKTFIGPDAGVGETT